MKIPDEVICGTRVRCWDSPKYGDRYTVLYMSETARYSCGRRMLPGMGMSENPSHPQGIGQHLEAHAGRHLGTPIAFNDLPESVRRAIRNDLNKED